MKRFLLFFLLLASMLGSFKHALAVCGTPGKDGVGPSGGVVNSYFASAQSAAASNKTLQLSLGSRVGAINSITTGDLLLLWQTQGASIDSSDSPTYGSGLSSNDASGYTNLNGAGHFEFVRVTSAPDGTGLTGVAGDGVGGGLRFSYTYDDLAIPRQIFQVIRVPQYSSMTLTSPLQPVKYNGTTGGIIIVDVAGTLAFNTPVAADVYQTGFRGGFAPQNDYVLANSHSVYSVATRPRNGAGKGGGIVGSPRYTWNETSANDSGVEGYPGGDGGRGAPGNAGGGGNAHNAGGGGGSNSGGGGKGGYGWEGAGLQANTLTNTVNNSDGTTRQVARSGGSGGFPLRDGGAAFTDRLFMGGGGGGGDANDSVAGVRGGVGAGVVLLRAGRFTGSTTINANGDNGDRGAYLNNPDGAGGGGAGGTVILVSRGASSATFSVNAQGGAGGNTLNDPVDPGTRPLPAGQTAHGPGGGGGGGTVLYSAGLSVSTNSAGGASGFTNESGATHIQHGALAGSAGLNAPLSATNANNIFDFSDACGVTLSVSKTTTTPLITSGATTATYEVTVSNTGLGGASGVVVDDVLPTPFTYDAASPATPTYSFGSSGPATIAGSGTTTARFGTPGGDATNSFVIGPGASVKLTFPVKINSAAPGKYDNSANASFAEPQRTTNTTLVSPGGTYAGGGTVPGLNYNGSLPANTAEDVTIALPLSGIVFDDVNFAGKNSTPTGGGRAFDATKGMKGVNGARVELYNADGTFNSFVLSATVDGQDGVYTFPTLPDGAYFVRVVNSSVASSRTPGATGLVPVQTFQVADETNDNTNNATAFPNRVGGRFPAQNGAGANTTSASLNSATFALSTGGVAQSVSRTEVRNGATSAFSATSQGLAFGFNFDTVVNTNELGQGSLRQFILNANALSNTGLAQDGLTTGTESSIFSIPSPSDPLGRVADPRFVSGVAKITLASTLQIIGANAGLTGIDGATQTTNIGDTNAGTFGTGGTVGVGNVALPTLARPEIEINGPRTLGVGLDIEADNILVRGVSMWGFGGAGDSDGNATINVGTSSSTFVAPTISGVLLGTSAVPDGTGALIVQNNYGSGDLIRAHGVDGGLIQRSLLVYGGGKGIALRNSSDSWTVTGNEVRGNSRDQNGWDGIDAQSAGAQIIGNLFAANGGNGIDTFNSGTNATITNNTSRDNGQKSTPGVGEGAGIRIYGTSNTVSLNIVSNNYFAGITVEPTASALISRNSIFGNGSAVSGASATISGQIGIDLLRATDDQLHGTSPFVTPNDAGDGDAGGNGLLNFPIITSSSLAGGNLTIQGFAPAGSTLEVFVAQPDPSGFGQGKTFAFSVVEGSGSDTDSTTGAYNATTLQAQGFSASVAALAGSETNANKFRFVFPAGAITANSLLTATATIGSATSEFSPVLTQTNAASISGLVYLDANANAKREPGEAGATLRGFFIKLVPNGGTSATSAVAVNPDSTYGFTAPAPGTYSLVLDDNSTLTDIAPTIPAGFSATEAPGGVRAGVVVSSIGVPAQNFGLYAGYSLSGRVFEDNGLGGGVANDGLQNGSEAGIGGVNLQLKNGATVIATATTGLDGTYSFSVPASSSGQTLSVVETNATGYVSSGGQVGNTTGTYDRSSDTLTFPFNSANGTLTSVNFADVRGATLENDGAKIGTRGASVVYPHVLTAGTTGSVSFSLSQIATPAPGWTVALYNDLNGNGILDAGEPAILSSSPPIAATANSKINLLVINYVPQNAPDGSQDKITLSANFVPSVGGSNPALPAQILVRNDLTTVGPQLGVNLVKAVDKTSAKSGDLITYTLTYSNTGNTPISSLVVNDTTPAFTTFCSATFATLPNNLIAPVITAPNVGEAGAIKWTFGGSLAPGASGTVTFVVKVN